MLRKLSPDFRPLSRNKKVSTYSLLIHIYVHIFIAELVERSPIVIKNSSNPSSRKNLDVRPYDRSTVQGATFDMRGQLYRGHALGSESDDPGSSSSWDKLCGV